MIDLIFATLMVQSEIQPLKAEFYCTSFSILDRTLRQEFKEEPVVLGRSIKDKATLAIYSDPDNESFTILVVYSDRACVLGAGDQLWIKDFNKQF